MPRLWGEKPKHDNDIEAQFTAPSSGGYGSVKPTKSLQQREEEKKLQEEKEKQQQLKKGWCSIL